MWQPQIGAWLLDERVIHVQRPPTRQLIGLVLSEYAFRVVLASTRDPDDVAVLVNALLDPDDPLSSVLLDEIADGLVETWFGMPRWTVQRIWREAVELWRDVDGELGSRGVDVLAMPPDRATNAVYGVLRRWRSGDSVKFDRWLRDLDAPPQRSLAGDRGADAAAADWAAVAALAGMPAQPAAGVDSELITT